MDHERVNISQSGMSCGVLEISRLDNDSEAVCYAIASRLYHPSRGTPAAFIVWSDIAPKKDAYTFADWVAKERFGSIGKSAVVENPKTGNLILVYTWAIDHSAFKAWYAMKRVEKMKKVGA